MIQVWGGTHQIHLSKLQRILNNTARYILNEGRKWKTRKLMEAVNWLAAPELVDFHTLVALWKLKNFEVPIQLTQKFGWNEKQ